MILFTQDKGNSAQINKGQCRYRGAHKGRLEVERWILVGDEQDRITRDAIPEINCS